MDFLESHLEESKKIIIDHVNSNIPQIDESGKERLRLLAERSALIANTKFLELANERLKDFEEKIENLGFNPLETEELSEEYKSKLLKFLGSGYKEYLLRK